MNAVISGRSATALLIDGERLMSIQPHAINQPMPRQPADLPFLFGDCNDLQFLENVTPDQVAAHLKRACNNENALQMILILLDPELSKKVREEAAEALEELLTDELPAIKFDNLPMKTLDEPLANDYVTEHLQSLLYARPLPDSADPDGAIECSKVRSAVLVQSLLEKLQKLQPIIRKVRLAWEAIPNAIFGSDEKRAKWHTDVVREGVFPNLAMKIASGENVATVHMSSPLKPSATALPEFEAIQRRWIELLRHEFPASEKSAEQKEIETETQNAKQSWHVDSAWVESYREAIKHYLSKKWNLHGEDLDEVLQDIMITAFQSLIWGKYEARNNAVPVTYLIGIAKNVVQAYFRRRDRHERRRAFVEIAESIGVLFRDKTETEELARFLQEKFSKLPKKYVQVLELIYYQDYKERDAAAEMGIPIDKFYSLKSDALKRLRTLCKKDLEFKPRLLGFKSRLAEQKRVTSLDDRLLPKHSEKIIS